MTNHKRSRHAQSTLTCLLLFALTLLLSGETGLEAVKQSSTIMRSQTAAFVNDAKLATDLNEVAEFSSRMLYWTDTPREPFLNAGKVLKTALVPFIEEWNGEQKRGSAAASGIVRARVNEVFCTIDSPRIARITVDEAVTIRPPIRVDAFAGEKLEIPCVLENRRGMPISLEISALKQGLREKLFVATLAAGQTKSLFLSLSDSLSPNEVAMVATIDGRDHSFSLAILRRPSGSLDVEILDDAGGPTPARVYLTGSDCRSYAPLGTIQRLVTGEYGQPFAGDAYFHSGGRFSIEMPEGEATLEVLKGFEYQPVRLNVNIEAKKHTKIAVRLKRLSSLRSEGWYSGDTHVHANLFAQDIITPRDVHLVAQAEDLNVVNLLPCGDPRTGKITDIQYFTGQPDLASTSEHILYFNGELLNEIYGHVGFLGLKSMVEPAFTGWRPSPYPYDYPGNYSQAAQAKAQKAAVIYVHPALPSEFPVDIALGLADTIDVMSQNDENRTTDYWYRLLNCGFRCPISAGTDSFLNVPQHLIPGAGRVYVHVGSEFNFQRWLEGFLAGRSFATNGPLLRFAVNGRGAGEDIEVSGSCEIEVTGEAQSIIPMEALELVVNGHVVRRCEVKDNPYSLYLSERIRVARSSWIALRVRGSGHRFAPNDREVYAHTSPVYVTVDGRRISTRADAYFFIEQIDILVANIYAKANFENPEQQSKIVKRFREAQAIYREIAENASTSP